MTSAASTDDRRASRDRSPFGLLGLPASAEVTDEDVHAAWRRIAAVTHPDRPDGGDAARFAAASAAYTTLRTRFGRGEALADLGRSRARLGAFSPPREASVARQAAVAPGLRPTGPPRPTPVPPVPAVPAVPAAPASPPAPPTRTASPPAGLVTRAVARVRNGRPFVLAVRLVIVAAAGAGSAALVGPAPATPALITGAVTWLLLTARGDLAPPR